jgi:hypothetical protein
MVIPGALLGFGVVALVLVIYARAKTPGSATNELIEFFRRRRK